MVCQAVLPFLLLLSLSPGQVRSNLESEPFKVSLNELTQRMYNFLASEGKEENFVFSPLSLHQALTTLYFGATTNSKTEQELRTLLSGVASRNSLESYYESLTSTFRNQSSIKIGNSIWLQQSLTFKKKFVKDIEKILGSNTETVDFTNETTVDYINKWVHERTNGLIPSIVESLDPQTGLFIANALYFRGKWLYPFQETHLNGDPLTDTLFNLEDGNGTKISVPMMLSKSEDIGYGKISKFGVLAEVLHIPYISEQYRMKIIIPANKTQMPLNALEDFMTRNEENTEDNIFSMEFENEYPESVRVIMPKFKIHSEMEATDLLRKTGLTQIFKDAELDSLLDEDTPAGLAVSKVLQKSVITVDKEGTEGASATGIGLVLLSGSFGERIEINLDRPFIFVVEQVKDNIPILVGRVKNPGTD